jgi:hypothetical protein
MPCHPVRVEAVSRSRPGCLNGQRQPPLRVIAPTVRVAALDLEGGRVHPRRRGSLVSQAVSRDRLCLARRVRC